MTRYAVINKRCVIHGGRDPGTDGMTRVAFLGGRNVGDTFTRRDGAIMATTAHADDFVMVHGGIGHGDPRGGCR